MNSPAEARSGHVFPWEVTAHQVLLWPTRTFARNDTRNSTEFRTEFRNSGYTILNCREPAFKITGSGHGPGLRPGPWHPTSKPGRGLGVPLTTPARGQWLFSSTVRTFSHRAVTTTGGWYGCSPIVGFATVCETCGYARCFPSGCRRLDTSIGRFHVRHTYLAAGIPGIRGVSMSDAD